MLHLHRNQRIIMKSSCILSVMGFCVSRNASVNLSWNALLNANSCRPPKYAVVADGKLISINCRDSCHFVQITNAYATETRMAKRKKNFLQGLFSEKKKKKPTKNVTAENIKEECCRPNNKCTSAVPFSEPMKAVQRK